MDSAAWISFAALSHTQELSPGMDLCQTEALAISENL